MYMFSELDRMIAGTGCRNAVREESPGSIGQGCRAVPGEGNFKESATEKKTAASFGMR